MTQLQFNVIGIDDILTSPLERFTCATNDGSSIYLGSDSVSGNPHVWKYSTNLNKWYRITKNLNNSSIKSISSIRYNDSKLYIGTGSNFAEYGSGRVFYDGGTSRGWVDLKIESSINANSSIRSMLFNGNDIYATGFYYVVWKYSNGNWSELLPAGIPAFLNNPFFLDLATDDTNIYVGGCAGGIDDPSASIVYKYDGASWTQINVDGFEDLQNLSVNKLCWHKNKLYAATFNDEDGTQVFEYDGTGTSWTKINSNGFGYHGNYQVADLQSVGDNLVASIEGIHGGEIWVYDDISETWEKNVITSDVVYKSYLIQRVGSQNYLIGTCRKNFITQPSGAAWITYSERQSASANYFPDGYLGMIPIENNKFRFFGANSLFQFVSEGTLEDPLQIVRSNQVSSLALQLIGLPNGITKGTPILDKKPDFSGYNPSSVTDPVSLPNVRYMAGGIVYKIPDTSNIIMWCHAEDGYWDLGSTGAAFGGTYFNSNIRQVVSFDNGLSFYDCGKVLESRYLGRPNTNVLTQGMGLGGYVIRDGYFYFYYNTDTVGSSIPNQLTYMSVMRAPYEDVIASALNKNVCSWNKYYGGSFSQPSIGGGNSTDLINYIWDPGWAVTYYSPTLKKYVTFNGSRRNTLDYNLFYEVANLSQNKTECYAVFSDDGFLWSFPEKISSFQVNSLYTLPLNPSGHEGLLADEFLIYGMPNDWTAVSSEYQTVATQNLRNISRVYEIEKLPYYSNKSIDRGQLHPLLSIMHYIGEQRKLLQASAYYSNNLDDLDSNGWWSNLLQNYANTITESSGAFPNSFEDYTNFEFGRELHKLYYEYTHTFNNHRVSKLILNQNGPNILSHALGSLLYSSDFTERGSLALQNPQIITTNLARLS